MSERELIDRAQGGDEAARNALIEMHLGAIRLAVGAAVGRGLEDEYLYAGVLGFVKGLESYEHGRGSKLVTWTHRAIVWMVRSERRDDRLVWAPQSAKLSAERWEAACRSFKPAEYVAAMGPAADDPLLYVLEGEDETGLIMRAIEMLPSRVDRRVLMSKAVGLLQREIAAESGRGKSTVSKQCRLARERLEMALRLIRKYGERDARRMLAQYAVGVGRKRTGA